MMHLRRECYLSTLTRQKGVFMSEKAKELVAQMTLEEKASICAGENFWQMRGVPRLGIRPIMVTDGPHGLRKQVGEADMLGLNASVMSIAFPAGCAQAASFDPSVAQCIGDQLGKICQAEDVSVILGPAMNIKRSPLCGRNFEYYSEDPLLSTKMGTGSVKGIQANHVGTSPKHYLANNQEHFRMTSNSVVDERTLREIYLASFECMVRDSKPWTVMNSYNKINGTYASENKEFLTDVLRGEWGFDGYVMTDWGACDDPVDSLNAGLDVAMPGPSPENVRRIIEAVKDGRVTEEKLDEACVNVINKYVEYTENHVEGFEYDYEAGHAVAKAAAQESAVLLKNDGVLPLAAGQKVLVIGRYAKKPRYQGGGSSHLNPYKVTGAWSVLEGREGFSWVEGYTDNDDQGTLCEEAVAAARDADVVVIFAGLPDSFESEGYDRKHLNMPAQQNALIEAVAAANPKTVVVLHNGAPVVMPWLSKVAGVLEMYLGGEAVGEAAAALLLGEANPCGHLPETFPLCIEDTPTYPYYGVERHDVVYREGIMVGYRYYTTKKMPVLFPFGYGLSYTDFEYSNLRVSKEAMEDTENVDVTVCVKNTGTVAGKALVQLYVAADVADEVVRAARELRGFAKVELAPGEAKDVTITLDKRAFAYWNTEIHDWLAATGNYKIQIGTDADTMVLEQTIAVTATNAPKPHFTINSAMGDLMKNPVGAQILGQIMGGMSEDISANAGDDEDAAMSSEAAEVTGQAMPLRSLLSFSDQVKVDQIEGIIAAINAAL